MSGGDYGRSSDVVGVGATPKDLQRETLYTLREIRDLLNIIKVQIECITGNKITNEDIDHDN